MGKTYFGNLEQATLTNNDFRRVIHTGEHSQLVLMSLKPGEEIGIETHPHVDQFFRVESGMGQAIIGGNEINFTADDAFIVPSGTEHNVTNTGSEDLKLYTIYSPANHIENRIHPTRAEALADTADEDFGHRV